METKLQIQDTRNLKRYEDYVAQKELAKFELHKLSKTAQCHNLIDARKKSPSFRWEQFNLRQINFVHKKQNVKHNVVEEILRLKNQCVCNNKIFVF